MGLGGLCRLLGHDGLELDGGQTSEAGLPAAPVVGAFDPGHECDAKLGPGGPGTAVQNVLLHEAEEALHGRIVPARGDSSHGSHQTMAGESALILLGSELAAPVGVDHAPGDGGCQIVCVRGSTRANDWIDE